MDQQKFNFVNTDSFLQLCNQGKLSFNTQPQNDDKEWIFGQQNEKKTNSQNPFFQPYTQNDSRQIRSNSFIGSMNNNQYNQIQEQILMKPGEKIFDTGQAKSAYLNKITQLLDGKTKKESPPKNQIQKLRKKMDKKYNFNEEDEIEEEPIMVQDKLAKNRESAKNSRKRKKMYIELLESKVIELQEQLQQTRQLCQNYQEYLCQELIMNQEQWRNKASEYIQEDNEKMVQDLQISEFRIQETSKQINQIMINKILDNLYPFPLNYLIDDQLNAEVQWELQQLENSILQISQSLNEAFQLQYNLQASYNKMIRQMDYKNHQKLIQILLEKQNNISRSGSDISQGERKLVKV